MKETTSQADARLTAQLQALRCPECQSGLHFGGWSNVYRYIQFDQMHHGWQEGKDKSDGNSLECSKNFNHNVGPAIPENWDEINDFLHSL